MTDFVVCFVSSDFDLAPPAHPVNRQYFETTWTTAWTIIDLPLLLEFGNRSLYTCCILEQLLTRVVFGNRSLASYAETTEENDD